MGNVQPTTREQSDSPLGRASVDSGITYERRRRHSSQDEPPHVLNRLRGTASPGVPAQPGHAPLLHQHSVPIGVPHVPRTQLQPEQEPESELDPSQSRLLPIVVQWKKGGADVQLCGSFTQWKKVPMACTENKAEHQEHMSIVNVPEGRHEYKFWVDGLWRVDPAEPTADGPDGSKLNYIVVNAADFQACDALNMDNFSPAREASGSPPGPYGQVRPETSPKPWLPAQPLRTQGPPSLPPHLLEVMLNKDLPATHEPTLLPAPNHVMLNHLYALSIKDGVMVLSATHRYRKKYVTTLLYKPI